MVLNKVTSILSDLFGMDEDSIDLTDTLEEIGIDTVAMVDLALALESEFDVEISDEENSKWETVDDIVNFIEEKV